MPEKKEYEKLLSGSYYDKDGNEIIIIFGIRPSKFLSNEDDDIITEYHYKYVVNDDNELDDIELLKKVDTYATTGEEVYND